MPKFNVKFTGEIAPDQDLNKVKEKLAALLKLDAAKMERLFTGATVVIRKDVDQAVAEKLQQVFRYAGAVCELEPLVNEEQSLVLEPLEDPAREALGAAMEESEDAEEEASPEPGMALPPEASGKEGASGTAGAEELESGVSGPFQVQSEPVAQHFGETASGGRMLLTTIEFIPGATVVEHFGLVSGSTIRAKHVGRDIMASLKNIVGGELKGYTQLLQESRQQATDRMVAQAEELGANAIINVRYSTSSVAQGAAELYAYGTAVRIKEGPPWNN